MNILRRLPLSRLILLCGLVVAIGVSATALASALGGGPVPAPKPLAQAVHDALSGGSVQGFSARVKLTNHLIEGAELAGGSGGSGGGLASSPLLTGASGRMWVSSDGRVRLELQSEKGDTQVIYDGHTIQAYDASSNTLYRYTPETGKTGNGGGTPYPLRSGSAGTDTHDGTPPTLAKIEEGIAHLREHAGVSGATPVDVGGQAAYTVRVSPKESGSLIGGAELSFDAAHGIPLRAAIYSSTTPDPVIELAASDVSYAPVDPSVFSFTPPPGAKVQEIASSEHAASATKTDSGEHPKVTLHGHGISSIAVLEGKAGKAKGGEEGGLSGLPKVKINGTEASELRTSLGTVLSFERGGIRYLVAGAVEPAAVEALARGL